jgi:hypothetical protein
VDAVRLQVGPHRLFVAFSLRLLEGSGVSACESSDALASERLQQAVDKRAGVPAYELFVTPLWRVASPSEKAWVPAFS